MGGRGRGRRHAEAAAARAALRYPGHCVACFVIPGQGFGSPIFGTHACVVLLLACGGGRWPGITGLLGRAACPGRPWRSTKHELIAYAALPLPGQFHRRKSPFLTDAVGSIKQTRQQIMLLSEDAWENPEKKCMYRCVVAMSVRSLCCVLSGVTCF